MRFTRVRALSVVLIAFAASAVVALQSPAEAAVTSSTVTTPANGTHYTVTTQHPPTGTVVAGTTNGTTGDFVDIRCYYAPNRYASGPSDVPVQANGKFSTSMATPALGYGRCRLVAVPAGFGSGSSLTPYAGPVITTEARYPLTVPSGPNAGKTYDYYISYQGSAAFNDYTSVSDGGLWDSRLQPSADHSSDFLWYGNAFLDGSETGGRSMLQVDGKNAYGPYAAHSYFADNPGLPTLTWSTSRNAAGTTTIHETDPIVACSSETAFPPTAASCPTFVSTGIRLDRTMVATDGGRRVLVTDVWRSTDGKAHAINAHYGQNVEGTDYSGASSRSTDVAFKLSWAGGYRLWSSPETYGGTTKVPSTVYVHDDDAAADGAAGLPRGAMTVDYPVSGGVHRFNVPDIALQTAFSVPAHGTRTVRHAFVMGTRESQVAAIAAADRARLNPFRSDGVIKRPGAGAVGNGVYGTSGAGETATAKVKRGHKVTFVVTVQNDGTRATSFRLRGAGGGSGFAVAYLQGASGHTVITHAVTHGTYLLAHLAPGQSRVLRVVVTVKHGTSVGALRAWLLAATSTDDAASKDVVAARVRVVG